MANDKRENITAQWNLIPKGIFICMSLAYYCVYTFRDYFLRYFLGLNNKIGWFSAVIAIATFVGGLFWAKSSDLSGDYTTPLILCASLSVAVFNGMYFLKFGTGLTLAIGLVCFALNGFFLSAFQPLVDVLVLRIIPDKETYGKQRLWLPITYGFITFLMSYLCNQLGWVLVFPAMALLNSLFILYILFFVRNPPTSESLRRSRKAQTLAQDGAERTPGFRTLLRLKRFLFVMLIVFFLGIVRGIFTVFLSSYQKDVIHIHHNAISFTPLTGLSLEIPIFFWGKSIMRVLGVDYCLLTALFLGLVRIVSYLVVAKVSITYPGHPVLYGVLVCTIELLKGPCFALTHNAAIKIVLAETPEILHGRAQALYAGLYNNLSTLISSLIGQKILDIYGEKPNMTPEDKEQHQYKAGIVLFSVAAIFTIVAMLMGVARLVMDRRRVAKNPPQPSEQPDEPVEESQPILEKDRVEVEAEESAKAEVCK